MDINAIFQHIAKVYFTCISLAAILNFKVKTTKEKWATSDSLKCVPRASQKCMLTTCNIRIPWNNYFLHKADKDIVFDAGTLKGFLCIIF